MSLVTTDRYVEITGDNDAAPGAMDSALDRAQSVVEAYLRRPLENAERTETTVIARNGRVYPRVTPITSAPDYTILENGHSLGGAQDSFEDFLVERTYVDQEPVATITYTGGWTEATLPETIARQIARLAYAFLHPVPGVPAGANSVRVGDLSVNFSEPVGPAPGLDGQARRELRGWRKR